ncbi:MULTISPECIES: ATP-binding protein [Thalassolituus]|uniref:ATP-binding protein n=1 Tax=Thalassolituus TaxID=187492 RepID=UPI000C5A9218|nr:MULTISPECIES: ATP-binding protein [Thalassolituus]MAX85795.1 hypothetical protein [Oceanospirillaceae bacterium]|tara:strand:+ start:7587 stop:10799 length:3213 start_codon:yes stop_codon:yes gene_type:complete
MNFDTGYSLVLGSGACAADIRLDAINKSLQEKFSPDSKPQENLFKTVSLLIDLGVQKSTIKSEIDRIIHNSPKSELVTKISQKPWKSVISLTLDVRVLDAINEEINRSSSTRTITTISGVTSKAPANSTPYYALYGDLRDTRPGNELCLTEAEYLKKRREWRKLLATFPDYNKASPMVFMGTNGDRDFVKDLLNELLYFSPGLPSKLVFFKGDPCSEDSSIRALLPYDTKVEVIDSTLYTWLTSTKDVRQLSLPLGTLEGINYKVLSNIDDRIAIVPRDEDFKNVPISSSNKLLDHLCRPSELNWEPYNACIDFPRDITEVIKEKILEFSKQRSPSLITLSGEAGVGKSTVMRRVAYDFSNDGYLCIWLKRNIGYNQPASWATVIQKIRQSIKGAPDTKILFFIDRNLERFEKSDELIQVLSNESLNWCVVNSKRPSSEVLNDENRITIPDSIYEFVIDFPDDLSDNEINGLEEYLVSVNATNDKKSSKALIDSATSKNSKDALCALWFLLPNTRSSISESLADEYYSLGGIDGIVKEIAKESSSHKEWARTAYELVTTMSGLGLPLPVEVLVRSLGISYQSWLESCSEGKPLWGLIYGENYNDGESISYRTRNEVVTQVLIQILNGGFASHTGEHQRLKDILSSCDGETRIYVNTAHEILISKKKDLKKKFNFEQGLELFDIAIESLTYEDRTLIHHRGLWIRDMGNSQADAYKEILKSVDADTNPLLEKEENVGNIHTSLASCVVNQLSEEQDLERSKTHIETIKSHLKEAENRNPFDLHNKHVSANMYLKAAAKVKDDDRDSFLESLANAVRIISDSFKLIERTTVNSKNDSYEMLRSLEEQIYKNIDNLDEMEDLAISEYSSERTQTGFYVIIKALLSQAISSGKGKSFNKVQEKFEKYSSIINDNHDQLDIKLVECRAELEFEWHAMRSSSSSPDWIAINSDVSELIINTHSRNPNFRFYKAVSLFHLRDYASSDVEFNQLRASEIPSYIRRAKRCFYLDKVGHIAKLEGQLTGTKKKYIFCPALSRDILASGEFTERDDTTVHFYIAFSMQGPIAVKNKPTGDF